VSAIVATSAVSHRRNRRARAWLESRVPAEEVLIIGASLDAANELARRVAEEKGAAFGWHRLTLPQLAAALAGPVLAERKLAPLSRLGAEAIVASVMHRLKARGGLGRYQPVGETPGFARAIAAVIAELRLARLTSDAIGKVAPDLTRLTEAYEAALAEAELIDWPGVLNLAREAASGRAGVEGGPEDTEGGNFTTEAQRTQRREKMEMGADTCDTHPLPRIVKPFPTLGGIHRLIKLPMLLLDVPITGEAELAFLRALAAAAPDTLATVPAADQPTLGRIRDVLHWKFEDLDRAPRRKDRVGKEGALERLQRQLFSGHTTVSQASPDNQVEVFSAPGESRECVEVARRVLAFARNGIPFDRIAVLLRSPEEYRAHLQEAFARAGIPAHFARGAVRPDPAGRAFYSLLKCAAEGLSARRFAEYLSLGQVPDAGAGGVPPEATARGDRWVVPDPELVPQFTTSAADEPISPTETNIPTLGSDEPPALEGQLRAPRRWERLLVEAAVIGGRDRWRRRIEGLANDLRLRLAEIGEGDEALARTLEDLGLCRLRPPSHRWAR
jgi:hypothetical protein